MTAPVQENPELRCGMVAVVGRANVGKSTLVNRILGEKISIVTPVAQTTRNLVRGMLTEPRGQIVFLDTPGLHQARSPLGQLLNKVARSSIKGVDLIMPVFDISVPPRIEDEGWMRRLMREETAALPVLNKCDRPTSHADDYRTLWERIAREKKAAPVVHAWRSVSALTGKGVDDLVDHLFDLMPVGPLLFPEDVLTDFPRKLFIADIIREKLFARLREELPHAVAVWIDDLKEDDLSLVVEAVIYVDKPSQKGIVIGEKGRLLRAVRRAAEAELAVVFEKKVRLSLWVKVSRNWKKNYWMLKKLGYQPT